MRFKDFLGPVARVKKKKKKKKPSIVLTRKPRQVVNWNFNYKSCF